MFEIEISAATHRGTVKESNEDCVSVQGYSSQAADGGVATFIFTDQEPGIVLVADGVGGRRYGATASRTALACLHEMRALAVTDITMWFSSADKQLRSAMEQHPDTMGMATTVCGFVCHRGVADIVNAGDSPCFGWNDGFLTKLSTDDSGAHEIGGRTNVVTQVVGGRKDRSVSPLVPHRRTVTLRSGDRYLLCSDGLTAAVPIATCESLFRRSLTGKQLVLDLLAEALRNDAHDNVSLCVVDVFNVETQTASPPPPTSNATPVATPDTSNQADTQQPAKGAWPRKLLRPFGTGHKHTAPDAGLGTSKP